MSIHHEDGRWTEKGSDATREVHTTLKELYRKLREEHGLTRAEAVMVITVEAGTIDCMYTLTKQSDARKALKQKLDK